MSWILYLVLGAFALYLCYNFAALSLFGAPKSLSNTFYLFQERKPWQRFLFPVMMVGMAFLLLPAWLEISAASPLMFMAFFAAGGILFTGAAPAFNSGQMENRVHTISAIFAATFALLWVIFVAKLWWFIIVWFVLIALISLLTNTWKTSYVYWLETVAFMSTFTAIIAFFLL